MHNTGLHTLIQDWEEEESATIKSFNYFSIGLFHEIKLYIWEGYTRRSNKYPVIWNIIRSENYFRLTAYHRFIAIIRFRNLFPLPGNEVEKIAFRRQKYIFLLPAENYCSNIICGFCFTLPATFLAETFRTGISIRNWLIQLNKPTVWFLGFDAVFLC